MKSLYLSKVWNSTWIQALLLLQIVKYLGGHAPYVVLEVLACDVNNVAVVHGTHLLHLCLHLLLDNLLLSFRQEVSHGLLVVLALELDMGAAAVAEAAGAAGAACESHVVLFLNGIPV